MRVIDCLGPGEENNVKSEALTVKRPRLPIPVHASLFTLHFSGAVA